MVRLQLTEAVFFFTSQGVLQGVAPQAPCRAMQSAGRVQRYATGIKTVQYVSFLLQWLRRDIAGKSVEGVHLRKTTHCGFESSDHC